MFTFSGEIKKDTDIRVDKTLIIIRICEKLIKFGVTLKGVGENCEKLKVWNSYGDSKGCNFIVVK